MCAATDVGRAAVVFGLGVVLVGFCCVLSAGAYGLYRIIEDVRK